MLKPNKKKHHISELCNWEWEESILQKRASGWVMGKKKMSVAKSDAQALTNDSFVPGTLGWTQFALLRKGHVAESIQKWISLKGVVDISEFGV